jgi:protein-disulfide isomerase
VGKIFISYRRTDAAGHAGWLRDRLASRFGERNVFMDIRSIQGGEDFVEAVQKALKSCDAVLAVMGREWLSSADGTARRRIEDPDDNVRVELVTALESGVRVIPVLLESATMPGADQLPGPLKPLSRRNAMEISDARWDYDVDRLVRLLEDVVKPRWVERASRVFARRMSIGAFLLFAVVVAATSVAFLSRRSQVIWPDPPAPSPTMTVARTGTTVQPSRPRPDAAPRGADIPIGQSAVRGPKAAPVTLTAFEDFQCPFCAQSTQVIKQVLAAYPNQVKYVYKNFPLTTIHPNAMPAARAAVAAGKQGKFWEMHDLLFENTRDLGRDRLRDYARRIGLDIGRWERDVDSPDVIDQINAEIEQARAADVRGTPTFFVNRQRVQDRSVDGFARLIDAALKRQ